MDSLPDVSIITPYRNAAGFLPQLVQTLRQQSHGSWESLLIDDHSSDGGPELLAHLTASDRRFRMLTLPDRPSGESDQRFPAIPRNVGLAHATAPLVAFLDVDDLWHPCKLERQLAFHAAAGCDLSVTAYGRFRDLHQPVEALRCPPGELSRAELRQRNVVPLLTVLIRRELLGAGFTATHHEDYLQWLNLLRDAPALRYGCLQEVLACYRLHPGNLSHRRPSLLVWTYQVFRLHGMGHRRSLIQLMRWGFRHGVSLWRESRQRQLGLPTAASLLAASEPLLLTAAARW
ncbi:MAG: glycosyltransferase family 2 protein [Cyanobacteriota bacterium]